MLRPTTRTIATLGVAALATAATVVTAAPAAALAAVPTVVVHMSPKHVSLSTGNRMHAGRTIFKVVTGKGDHVLQIARLRNGYTLAQASADLGKAFSGNTKAIRRVDRNIVFRGGAETRPNKPGWMAVSLPAGKFVFLDQNTNSFTMVKVFGKAPPRQQIATHGLITAFTYGFATNRATLPHQGWIQFRNNADQPHFVEFQHVKQGTTNAQVRHYFKSGGRGRPSFALPGSYGLGVLTPGQGASQYLNLASGKYLIACFWPDFRTGMPHAFMGMWKLVQLG